MFSLCVSKRVYFLFLSYLCKCTIECTNHRYLLENVSSWLWLLIKRALTSTLTLLIITYVETLLDIFGYVSRAEKKRHFSKLWEHSHCYHCRRSSGRCAFGIDTDLQNNPNNIYFKKVEELFARNINSSWLFRFGELAPRIANVINKTLFGINIGRVAINMYLLPLISKKQLHETPNIWLFKRLHPIIEQRQQTPTSRVDLLALMLKVMSEEAVNVSVIKIYRT